MKTTKDTPVGTQYASLSFDEICARLSERKNTLILSHVNPDGDTLGCAFTLKEIVESTGAFAHVLCACEIPAALRFLGLSQESILPESIPAEVEFDRVIAVDVAAPSQLGALYDSFGGKIEFMIDHHGRGSVFADHYIDDTAAAAGEIVYLIAKRLTEERGFALSDRAHACLYAAISSDTGCFKYSNTTPRTHLIASELIRNGMDFSEINRLLFDSMSPARLKLQRAVLNCITTHCGGKVALAAFSNKKITDLAIPYEEYTHAIDTVRSLEGVEVAMVIRQPSEESVFQASMRSVSGIDVSEICSEFGGGGHKKAAGVTFACESIEKAAELLIRAVEKRML